MRAVAGWTDAVQSFPSLKWIPTCLVGSFGSGDCKKRGEEECRSKVEDENHQAVRSLE